VPGGAKRPALRSAREDSLFARGARRGEDTAPYRFGSLFHLLAMDLPIRKRLPHEIPQWGSDGSFFFITINCQPRDANHLCRAGVGDAVLGAAAYYHEHLVWHCRLMLLMPDHLHGVIAVPREPGLKTAVSKWKKFLAREHKISWQRDFFDHRLRDHRQETEKLSYILMNPVRKGLCERAEDWPWSYRTNDRPSPR
jgi:putative transposase